jgi:circadian clock protein KaiC
MNDTATGIPGLDRVLRGGFPPDHVHLIQGPAGSGKTTLALQFLMAGTRLGEPGLYIGTSETEKEIREISTSHGWTLDGVTVHHHGPAERAAPETEIGQTMLLPAEVELPETMKTLRSLLNELKPRRVVIDSLTEIRVLAAQERWYRRQLILLKELLHDCTALLTEVLIGDHLAETIAYGVIELDRVSRSYGPDTRRLRVLKMRGRSFLSGYHDFRIQTGGISLYPRLIAAEHRRRFTPEVARSGLPELDALLGGGLDRGTSALFVGPSGAGKSALATQFVVAAAERAERSAMYVFDERLQTLFQRAEGIGLPLESYVEAGLVDVRQIDPAEVTPGEFGELVRHAVTENDVRMVVLDSLNGFIYAMPEERYIGLHLHELASYLNQQAVTSILVMTESSSHQLRGDVPVEASFFSDAVIWLRQFEFQGAVHKAIAVHKRRAGPHEPTIRELKFSSDGLHVGLPLTQFHGILTGTPRFVGASLDERDESGEHAERR